MNTVCITREHDDNSDDVTTDARERVVLLHGHNIVWAPRRDVYTAATADAAALHATATVQH